MKLVTVGIIGINGKYGQWLKKFLEELGHTVIGSDQETEMTNRQVVEQADVVIFSVWPKVTIKVIEAMVPFSKPEQLWLDITSLKEAPVEAMLKSEAEVVGLHPMCAPSVRTWRDQNVACCEVRCEKWRDWVHELLELTEATVRPVSPESHDETMTFVQGLPHAALLIIVMVLRVMSVDVRQTLGLATPVYRMVLATISRILSHDAKLYADIQLLNRHILPMLEILVKEAARFREIIRSGTMEDFIEEFQASADYLGPEVLEEYAELFGHIVRLIADLTGKNSITLQATRDRPGIMGEIGTIFGQEGINLTSFHSMPAGGVFRFVIAFEQKKGDPAVQKALQRINEETDVRVVL